MDTEALLAQLVALDTTSDRSNLELIALVEASLTQHGIPHERIRSGDGTKANLLARIGPPTEGGVVLSGHTDCVPVTSQPWSRDPFTLHREGGRLYGRGTADMKGFIAVVLSALGRLADLDLARPILLALSYDEEAGTIGAPALVERLVGTQPRPSAVVVGEPTSMQVATAHKGVRFVRTRVEGIEAHSSQPRNGANAVLAAMRIGMFIDALAARHRHERCDPRFEPPHTSFNVARIVGGEAINIVPRNCTLEWEYRPVPADDSDAIVDEVSAFVESEVLPQLRSTIGQGAVTSEVIATVRALSADGSAEAEDLVRKLTGFDGASRTVAFGTDGGHFQHAGLPTVVCGPGSIDQAHKPDEYVEVDQLRACEEFIDALASDLRR